MPFVRDRGNDLFIMEIKNINTERRSQMKDEETEESTWGKYRNYKIKRDTYIERCHQESQRLNENREKNRKKDARQKKAQRQKKRHRQEDLHSDSVRLFYQPIN